MSVVGSRVRRLRQERGLTQEQLAKWLRINRSYLSQIENGHAGNVGSDMVANLARGFRTSADYLLGLTPQSSLPPNPGPTEQESLLLRIFRSLHEDQRGMALAYSQWLAERFK